MRIDLNCNSKVSGLIEEEPSQLRGMYNHCSLAPLEAFDLDDNDRKKKPREDEDEAKRQKRRNRRPLPPDGLGWGVQSAVNNGRCKRDRPPVSCERPQACPTLAPTDTKAKGRGRGANQGRKSNFHKIATVCSS